MLQLKEIADIFSGVAIRENKYGSARFMRLSDLSDLKAGRTPTLAMGDPPQVARALTIENGDLIVAARGVITDICIASGPVFGAYISLDLYLVRPNKKIANSQYLAAYLSLPSTQAVFAGHKQGSSLARLAKDAFESTEIPVPPLPAQQRIADLALSFEEEDKILRQLTSLNAAFSRVAVARAIRAAEKNQTSPRSPQP